MKQVVIMQGVSGSGKSTLARRMVKEAHDAGTNGIVVSADDFFYNLGAGTYKYDGTKIDEAHNACFLMFLDVVRDWSEGLIVVDNTNTVVADIAPYMRAASAFKWDATVLRIKIDPQVAAARGTKGLKPKDVETMFENILRQQYPRWWKFQTVDAQGVDHA